MYKFSLESVLNYRKTQEENHQKELGLLKRSLLKEKNKSEELNQARKEVSKELKNKQQDGLTVSETMLYIRFIDQLSDRLKIQKEKILISEKNVEHKISELNASVIKRKTLEILKEKRHKKYMEKMDRAEQNIMDEMASLRFKTKY